MVISVLKKVYFSFFCLSINMKTTKIPSKTRIFVPSVEKSSINSSKSFIFKIILKFSV